MLGPIIISIPGTELSANDHKLLSHPAIGGVILFSENFIDKHQLQRLVRSIKDIKDPDLLIFVDQEGGRIQRFRNDFFNLPSHRDLGRVYDQNIKNGVIKNPPPTPNKPERTPTNALNKSISIGLTKTCAIGKKTSI